LAVGSVFGRQNFPFRHLRLSISDFRAHALLSIQWEISR
jgi:hypothetical protein